MPKAEKSTKLNLEFAYPCYCCIFNNLEQEDDPCNFCENNVGAEEYKGNFFEPILNPK